MLAHGLYVFFRLCHLFLVPQQSYDVVSGGDAQFGEKRLYHEQVAVVGTIEDHGVYIL